MNRERPFSPGSRPSPESEGSPEDLFASSEQVEQVEREARQAGFDAGYADGRKAAMDDVAPLREAWIAWASRLPDFESERLKSMVPLLVSLLDTAFRKVMGETLSRPESLKLLVERMVAEYAGGRTADLLLSETDYRQVMEFDPEFRKELETRGVRMGVGPDLLDHGVELRFPDRIVSFDPEEAAASLRRTLSRGAVSQISDIPVGNPSPGMDDEGKSE